MELYKSPIRIQERTWVVRSGSHFSKTRFSKTVYAIRAENISTICFTFG